MPSRPTRLIFDGLDLRRVRHLRITPWSWRDQFRLALRLRTLGGLWIEGDPPPAPLGPRRMGLLAIVAAAGPKGVSRERVVGILWAEHNEESARHTLAQNLYSLKRQADDRLIEATPELRLGPGLDSDVGDLLDAIAAGDADAINRLYTGDFLDGFYLARAPEFERWVEEERGRLRSAVLRSHERFAAAADERGAFDESIRAWRRLSEMEPLSARYAAGLMRALAALGDRPAALSHAMAYEEFVRRELESEPDPSIVQLVGLLRDPEYDSRLSGPAPDLVPPRSAPASTRQPQARPAGTVPPPVPRRRFPTRASLLLISVVGAIALLAGSAGIRDWLSGADGAPPVLAVGPIRAAHPADSAGLSPIIRDMLATSLGAVRGLQVVSNSRLVELAPSAPVTDDGGVTGAARRAGADEVLEGEISTTDSGLTLSLRRVDLRTGVVRQGYVIRGTDRFSIVERAASAIVRDFGLSPPAIDIAESRTTSTRAYALYEEGLQAWYSADVPATSRLMIAALEQDSVFAMAAYYAWLAALAQTAEPELSTARDRVRRLAPRAVDRERLLIEGSIASSEAPIATSLAIAETLAVRYPFDADGLLLLGSARFSAGDWSGAVAILEKAVALDSTAGLTTGPECRICRALTVMSDAYLWWDSAPAAERTARRLIARRPDESSSWGILVEPLLRQGRREEAEAAARRHAGLGAEVRASEYLLNRDLIRSGRFDDLERELASALHSPLDAARYDARWLLMLSLRAQGRLAEALELGRDGILPGSTERMTDVAPDVAHLAFLPFQSGDPRTAAVRFREQASQTRAGGGTAGAKARTVTWNLTLAGTALAAAGDTASLRALADTVELTGRESTFGRDPRLHHFLRGLLLQTAGRTEDAVAAYRRAMFSTTDGYTRINLMLAQCLIELGRPGEAIAVLQPALRGGVDGGNTWVTFTELHLAVADAFAAAGQPDSAATHYRAVERAWQNADPQFSDRFRRASEAARADAPMPPSPMSGTPGTGPG